MLWVVGARGMLGTELCGLLESRGLEFVGTDREVDILDPGALGAFAAGTGKAISWIVNCAAYTAVDKAEDEPELCGRLNVEGPANLAALARGLGAAILHVSTDYVFDGKGTRPYREDDPVGPTGVYGRTKAQGEVALREACDRSVILRTAWLYGKDGPNFVYTMLRLMRRKDSIGVVADQRGSPTWARDLAGAMLAILSSGEPRYGTYHYSNADETNWHEFALEIMRLGREAGVLGRDCRVEALSTAQYPTKARRPAYSVLSKEKILADYGVEVPGWKESLAAFIKDLAVIARRQAAWFSHADYDMATAEYDLEGGRTISTVFWCQQAVEKALKALIEFEARPMPVRELPKLAAFLRLDTSPTQRRLMADLSESYRASRYSLDMGELLVFYSPDRTRTILEGTKELIAWLRAKNKLSFM